MQTEARRNVNVAKLHSLCPLGDELSSVSCQEDWKKVVTEVAPKLPLQSGTFGKNYTKSTKSKSEKFCTPDGMSSRNRQKKFNCKR